jgi:uncharacterized protein YecE (DUF72 family)
MPQRTRISPHLTKGGGRWQLCAGAPAWGDKGFIGKIYPPGTKAVDYLYHYARHFACIELNATFYRVPSPDTVHRWVTQTPPEFLFCPKFPQQISNHGLLSPPDGIENDFLEFAFSLGNQLGTTFLQLPQHFTPDRLQVLKAFLDRMPDDLPLAVEFRHPGWFTAAGLSDACFELLAGRNTGAVITDTSGRRDVLHLGITSSRIFIRFTGNQLHHTDYERIDGWVQQFAAWDNISVERIFFMIHQPEEHWCVDSALYLGGRLKTVTGKTMKVPDLPGGSGVQLPLFK